MQLEPEGMMGHNNGHYDSNNERHGSKEVKKFLKYSRKVEFKRENRQDKRARCLSAVKK